MIGNGCMIGAPAATGKGVQLIGRVPIIGKRRSISYPTSNLLGAFMLSGGNANDINGTTLVNRVDQANGNITLSSGVAASNGFLVFDGDQYHYATMPFLDTPRAQHTIAMTVNIPVANQYVLLSSYWQGSGQSLYELWVDFRTAPWTFFCSPRHGYTASAQVSGINTSSVFFIAMVHKSAITDLWVNNVKVASISGTFTSSKGGYTYGLASYCPPTFNTHNIIANIKDLFWYSSGITDEEVSQLYEYSMSA